MISRKRHISINSYRITHDVGRSPEEHGSRTARGNVTVEESQVGNSLFGTNVGKGTLVRVVEGSDLAGPVDLLGKALNLGSVGGGVGPQSSELLLELGLLAELLEDTGEVDTLLIGDLGSGGVRGGGTVTDGVDTLSAEQSEVVVDEETPSLGLDVRELGHKVSGDVPGSVTGSPDEETVRDLSDFLIGVLDDDALGLDVLDHGSGENINLVLLEGRLCVLDELLGEGGENVGEGLDKGDLESVGNLGVPLLKVILDTHY